MEANRRRKDNRGIEENTLAILDNCGFGRKQLQVAEQNQDLNDDRLTFLEAVRSSSIVPENGTAPTNKMFQAIFQILREEGSLDSIMSSYQLLNELEKRFPRVYVLEKTEKESSSHVAPLLELVVVEEAWCPFIFGADCSFSEKGASRTKPSGLLDPSGFHLLIKNLTEVDNKETSEESRSKLLRTMLLFQYLVSVLEGDFLPRNRIYKEYMNWSVLKESMLNTILGSRRIAYKALVKDCISVVCMCHVHSGTADDLLCSNEKLESCSSAVTIALPEVEQCLSNAMQKLLLMIMELDTLKEKADMLGLTSRTDGARTPAPEIILDELTYNRDILSPFLQVFHEPRWKLEIILQYMRKYIVKPSVCTRRSNGSTNNATFLEILKCFGNGSSTKVIIKKISAEVAQLLLAHAFQAYMSLPSEYSSEGTSDAMENVGGPLVEVCKSMITAFTNLKKTNGHVHSISVYRGFNHFDVSSIIIDLSWCRSIGILPFGKEALFTAATILST